MKTRVGFDVVRINVFRVEHRSNIIQIGHGLINARRGEKEEIFASVHTLCVSLLK